jgi:hypothetical protein
MMSRTPLRPRSTRCRRNAPRGSPSSLPLIAHMRRLCRCEHQDRRTVASSHTPLPASASRITSQTVTSVVKLGRIAVLAVTSGRCRPAPATSISRYRSCGARPSRHYRPIAETAERSNSNCRILRQIAPRRTGSHQPKDSVEHPAMGSTLRRGQRVQYARTRQLHRHFGCNDLAIAPVRRSMR